MSETNYIWRIHMVCGVEEKNDFCSAIYLIDPEAGPDSLTVSLPPEIDPDLPPPPTTHWGASGVYTEAQRLAYENVFDNFDTVQWARLTTGSEELQATNVAALQSAVGTNLSWNEFLAGVELI